MSVLLTCLAGYIIVAICAVSAISLRMLWSLITLSTLIISISRIPHLSVLNVTGLCLGALFIIYEYSVVRDVKTQGISFSQYLLTGITCIWGLMPWIACLNYHNSISWGYFVYILIIVMSSGALWRLLKIYAPHMIKHPKCYWIYPMFTCLVVCPVVSMKELFIYVWSPVVVYLLVNECRYLERVSEQAVIE